MALNGQTIIDETTLTGIGDAIRSKTGGTALLTLDQMIEEIGKMGAPSPYSWGWLYSISNITISSGYADQSEVYGNNLLYFGLGAEVITLTNLTTADDLKAWCNYLPEGGTANVYVLEGLLSEEEKAAITGKGYTVVEGA